VLGARTAASCSSWLAVSKAPIAAEAVRRIDELFAIEREINGKPAAERLAVRVERTKPLVIELEAWLRVQHARVSRKSEVGKAVAYALNQWAALTRFLEDGRICLSNNAPSGRCAGSPSAGGIGPSPARTAAASGPRRSTP
jgi:transposase